MGYKGTGTPTFWTTGTVPPLFGTQVKNLLSSEAICRDWITLKPFLAGRPGQFTSRLCIQGGHILPPELVPPLFRPKLLPCVENLNIDITCVISVWYVNAWRDQFGLNTMPSQYLIVHLSTDYCLYICLFVCWSVFCLSVCLSVFYDWLLKMRLLHIMTLIKRYWGLIVKWELLSRWQANSNNDCSNFNFVAVVDTFWVFLS